MYTHFEFHFRFHFHADVVVVAAAATTHDVYAFLSLFLFSSIRFILVRLDVCTYEQSVSLCVCVFVFCLFQKWNTRSCVRSAVTLYWSWYLWLVSFFLQYFFLLLLLLQNFLLFFFLQLPGFLAWINLIFRIHSIVRVHTHNDTEFIAHTLSLVSYDSVQILDSVAHLQRSCTYMYLKKSSYILLDSLTFPTHISLGDKCSIAKQCASVPAACIAHHEYSCCIFIHHSSSFLALSLASDCRALFFGCGILTNTRHPNWDTQRARDRVSVNIHSINAQFLLIFAIHKRNNDDGDDDDSYKNTHAALEFWGRIHVEQTERDPLQERKTTHIHLKC